MLIIQQIDFKQCCGILNGMFQRLIALILFIFVLPFFILFFILVKLVFKQQFIFKQKRLGKNKKPFTIYKIQTMVKDAEVLKSSYLHLNQADGPVFKIFNDPRYTKIGKLLSKTGLDELPQLINIMKGDMAFVGPRPLPVDEAKQIPAKYHKRFTILPGITSSWVTKGSHKLSFEEWMELDIHYVKNHSLILDLHIALKTIVLLLKAPFRLLK